MKLYVLDTNCFIAATHPENPAHAAVKEILDAADRNTISVGVSRHTIHELEQAARKYGEEELVLARKCRLLAYYPVGAIKDLLGTVNDLAGSWDDAKVNERIRECLQDLAKAGTDLRDRGAVIDAWRANADAFVTSDKQLVGAGPSSRIRLALGLAVSTPQAAAKLLTHSGTENSSMSVLSDERAKSGQLSAVIAELQRIVRQKGESTGLALIEHAEFDAIEKGALADPTGPFGIWQADILSAVTRAKSSFPNFPAFREIGDLVAEARVFRLLQGAGVNVRRLPPRSEPTPDFEVSVGTDTVFLEVKALDLEDGDAGARRRFDAAAANRAREAERLAKGERVVITETEIRTLKVNDPWSVRQYTEALAARIGGRLGTQQVAVGPVILIVELTRLWIPEGSIEELPRGQSGDTYSGILWHAAFGSIGDAMRKQPEFDGASTDDGVLQRNGVLRDYKGLYCLAFATRDKIHCAIAKDAPSEIRTVAQLISSSYVEAPRL